MYWILPTILVVCLIIAIFIAIIEYPPAFMFVIISSFLLLGYFDLVGYKEVNNIPIKNYTMLCNDDVCIVRIDNKQNLTIETKRLYDQIKSGNFKVYRTNTYTIFGRLVYFDYYIK